MSRLKHLHVMTNGEVLVHLAATCGTERLDGIEFSLLHFCGVAVFDNWHTFASMNLVQSNGVTVQIANGFHWLGN